MKIENSITLTKDNIKLATVKYIPENPKGIIYFCHGLSVPKEGPANILADTALALCDNDFKVISFDFRGHGLSEGKNEDFTIEAALNDLDAIIKTENNDLPIGMLGFSCGCTVIIEYAHLNNTKLSALVMFSPALDFAKTAMENEKSVMGAAYMNAKADGSYDEKGYVELPNGFRIGQDFFESINKYKVDKLVPKLNTKVLICQAERDQMLDYEHNRKLGEPISDQYNTYNTVHALIEEKEQVIQDTVAWFNTEI